MSTHYDDVRLDDAGEFSFEPTLQLEGLVFEEPVAWAAAGPAGGYVTLDAADACAASCHDHHREDPVIADEWAHSGHGEVDAYAFDHAFSTGVCLRCHSGIAFADYVGPSNDRYPDWVAHPGWSPPDDADGESGHRVTCNTCHDGIAYPTPSEPRLRIAGAVPLTSGSTRSGTFTTDAMIEAGASAACVLCHQGRENGNSLRAMLAAEGLDPVTDADAVLANASAVTPHYMAAAAILFSLKGFELPGRDYSRGILMHQGVLCVGCHAAADPDPELGGHTFRLRHGDATATAACEPCHGAVSSVDAVGFLRDLDGDGNVGGPRAELAALKSLLLDELGSQGVYYSATAYPHFFSVPVPEAQVYPNRAKSWTVRQLVAAFNLSLVDTEPGAHVHNPVYAAQLLWDAIEYLTGSPPASERPE